MLYKKFHRNYIRQFKVGTKIELYNYYSTAKVTVTILRAPYIDKYLQICIIDNDSMRVLFSHNGKKIRKYIKIVG